ncbi:AAA family ATPase [Antarcticimicrobium sediminis]|uniref:AAA family ATPase n=1 Tax=Antarcticimicrobium sediminis TaxID=2546227 RepID=A0A4R5EJD4_9RHOB|nr:AAA family ATPase [Antarcticimicrobium sediminis]TDE34681.1 AAA family ATPase [Antarcticimicrobium sediminis]
MAKKAQKCQFAQYSRLIASAIFRARYNIADDELKDVVPSKIMTAEQQVRAKYKPWSSPRLARSVARELRDIECKSYLDSIDSLAWLQCKAPNGSRNLYKFIRYRKELFRHSLSWILSELRDRRLGEFAGRSRREIDVDQEVQNQELILQDALWDLQRSTKRSAEERENEVVIFTAAERSSAKREDSSLKHFRAQLSEPMPLRRAYDRHHLDEMIAESYAAAPWMREPIEWLWRHNILLIDDPHPRIEIPPILLVGDPGTGKTHFATLFCNILGLTCARIDMSARSASFDITGTEFAWSSSTPGVPVRALASSPHANPVIVIDEIDKAGKGTNGGSPVHALLPLLQRDMARAFLCPSLQATVDLSWCGWIATANDADLVPAPILDRVKVFRIEAPRGKNLSELVWRTLEPVGAEPEVIDEVCRQIESDRMSLRGLGRLAHEFRSLQSQPTLH